MLTGTWDLVQSSVGYGYLNRDSVESYSTHFNSNHTLKFTGNRIILKSHTILELLNDSIVVVRKFKRRRSGSFIRLRKRKHNSSMYIAKLGFDALVLIERNENTIPSLFIETTYYYKRRLLTKSQPDYSFIGKWVTPSCESCTFWSDTISLSGDTTTGFGYGTNYYLTSNKNDHPTSEHDKFSVDVVNYPEPDTTDPYSHQYGKLSFGKIANGRDWVFDFEKKLLYFYPDFLSNEFLTYKVVECIPEERLILIRQN